MNAHDNDPRSLLDEVIPPAGERCGPGRDAVVGWARQARRRRARVRAAVAGAAIAAGVGLMLPPAPEDQPLAISPSTPPTLIEPIDDAQLLSLLGDRPVALMEWPNGERTLLILDP